jgi:glycosyltransferase involved in cell wall biosynthesis
MAKDKILYEAGPMLDSHKTGVGYYVTHLASTLQALYSNEIELTGYYFNFLNKRETKFPVNKHLQFKKITFIPGKIISLCRRLGFQPWLEIFIRRKKDTVIFTNYVALPQLHKSKMALVVYDLSYLDLPQYTQEVNLKYLRRFCSPSILKADVIITISNFTSDRLKYHFPNLKANVIVTPIPPITKQIEQTILNERLVNLGIKRGRYILFIGTIEPRKNLESLINAYALLSPEIQKSYSLVLAGGKGWKDEQIISEANRRRSEGLNIIMTGYVTDDEKAALYNNAACFTLPSHYEGFGMPILEAMQYNIPTVLSDIEVFHEVAGQAAIYFNKDEPKDIAEKLSSVIKDKNLRNLIINKTEGRLKSFSWEENAARVYNAIQ